MNSWRPAGHTARRSSHNYQLNFTCVGGDIGDPQPIADAVAVVDNNDDDVWDEELPQDALHEAILLESQVLANGRGAGGSGTGDRGTCDVTVSHAVLSADVMWDGADEELLGAAETPNVLVSAPDGCATAAAAAADNTGRCSDSQYRLQGEISVLRAELERKQRDIDSVRQTAALSTQKLQQEHNSELERLNRTVSALRADVRFKEHELSRVNRERISPRRKIARWSHDSAADTCTAVFASNNNSDYTDTSGQHPALRNCQKRPENCLTDGVLSRVSVPTQTDPIYFHSPDSALSYPSEAQRFVDQVMRECASEINNSSCLPRLIGILVELRNTASSSLSADNIQPLSCHLACRTAQCVDVYLKHLASMKKKQSGNRDDNAGRSGACCRDVSERSCVSLLNMLTSLAEWPLIGRQLAHCSDISRPLCQLIRPFISENYVVNTVVMQSGLILFAKLVTEDSPPELVSELTAICSETINTRPPQTLLSCVVELLISLAGVVRVSHDILHYRPASDPRPHTGTCLMKKLVILFHDHVLICRNSLRDNNYHNTTPSCGDICIHRYSLPSNHSRCSQTSSSALSCPSSSSTSSPPLCQTSLAPSAVAEDFTACGRSSDGVFTSSEDVNQPSVVSVMDVDISYQLCRLVALVLLEPVRRPTKPCCLNFLTTLTVQILCRHVLQWTHDEDCMSRRVIVHLLPCLHLLSRIHGAFSSVVARMRVHYLVAMETLASQRNQLGLSPDNFEMLKELYKFKSVT